jgi:glycosyltransferase involved in cell wall biosynthesis
MVLLPAFNESKTVGDVVQAIRNQGYHRVTVVDDGSTDDTARVAAAAGARVIRHIINRGPGAATQTGMALARREGMDVLVTLDADGQHEAADIEALLETVETEGADVVIGNRFMRGSNYIPQSRVVFNGLANLATYLFSAHWVSDTQSGFKAFSRKALNRLQLSIDGYGFCSEIIIKAQRFGLRIVERPIQVHYSDETIRKGQSFGNGMRTLAHLVQGYIFK